MCRDLPPVDGASEVTPSPPSPVASRFNLGSLVCSRIKKSRGADCICAPHQTTWETDTNSKKMLILALNLTACAANVTGVDQTRISDHLGDSATAVDANAKAHVTVLSTWCENWSRNPRFLRAASAVKSCDPHSRILSRLRCRARLDEGTLNREGEAVSPPGFKPVLLPRDDGCNALEDCVP